MIICSSIENLHDWQRLSGLCIPERTHVHGLHHSKAKVFEAHLWRWDLVVGRMGNPWSISRERLWEVSGTSFWFVKRWTLHPIVRNHRILVFPSKENLSSPSHPVPVGLAWFALLGFHADKGFKWFPTHLLGKYQPMTSHALLKIS